MAAKKHKLEIVGADEVIPRQIRAFGKACEGEFAMVLNPKHEQAIVIHVVGKGKKAKTYLWESPRANDVPARPSTETTITNALARLKDTKKNASASLGAAALRGKWSGYVECDDEGPRVVLTRRVAAYATVEVASSMRDGWKVTANRHGTWFKEAGSSTNVEYTATLQTAIGKGVMFARDLVADACVSRDTKRRAVVDATYAESHPNRRPADPKRDATDRLKAPGLGRPRKQPATEPAPAPASKPSTTAKSVGPNIVVAVVGDKPKGKGKVKSKAPAEVDAEKDKLLLDHMTKAIQGALEAA